MRKRITSLLLAFVLCLTLLPTAAFAADKEAGLTGEGAAEGEVNITGTGTEQDPYSIYTAAGLKTFRDKVNGGESGAHARLMNDIVLNDGTFDEDGAYSNGTPDAWTPIGSRTSNPYKGTFDGNGKTIKGLYVDVINHDQSNEYIYHAGLFGYTDGATIQDVTVDGYVSISGDFTDGEDSTNAGGIVGYATNTTITGCANLCTVKSACSNSSYGSNAGGIVGSVSATNSNRVYSVTECRNSGKVILMANYDGLNVGGIAGSSNVSVSNCYNTGDIKAAFTESDPNGFRVGGVVGQNGTGAQVKRCYNTGAVTVTGDYTVASDASDVGFGCVVGKSVGDVTNCCFLTGTTGTVTAGVGNTVPGGTTTNVEGKTKAEFADGRVLALLQNGDENSPWTTCGYLEAAGMIVPLLNGQTSGTFPIYTADDLKQFRDMVSAGDTGLCAKLMEDIDLGNEKWTPIGSKAEPYSGTFDGNGKTIKGLYVDERGNNTSAGLFGYIEIASSDTPVVQDLTVEGTVFAGEEVPEDDPDDYYGAGILVGEITVRAGSGAEYRTIQNCHVSGTVSSPMHVGGLAGHARNTHFENCTADVEVEGTQKYGFRIGGFVGLADQSEFTNCAAYGNVTNAGGTTGGFAGLLYYMTTVEHCAAYGNVEADRQNIGGFAGYVENRVTIKNSIAMGDVKSNNDIDISEFPKAGGFAGTIALYWGITITFEKCHANGTVTTAEGQVGYGMVGQAGNKEYFKTTDCSFNSEKNPSLKATNESEKREGIEGKNTLGVLFDVCVDYIGEHTDTDKDHKCDACKTVLSECADNDNDGKCDVCGKVLRSGSTGGGSSRPGYTVTVEKSANGSVTVSPKSASRGTTVTITVTPDKGYTLETLTVLDKNGKEVKLTKKNGKYTFTMPASKVTIKATFMDDNTMLNYFVDVKASDYYYDAVLWAAQNGITSGTDAAHFSPSLPCTRAQIVTFLWRAAGAPVVNYAMNMTDVLEDAYYAEAVRWALSEGITTGTTATTFSPDETCTRAQAVAFLFRFAAPAAVTLQELVSGFSDAASVPGYALSAMNWALAGGIVQGSGTKLLPNDACTRAQIVTLLYRTMK